MENNRRHEIPDLAKRRLPACKGVGERGQVTRRGASPYMYKYVGTRSVIGATAFDSPRPRGQLPSTDRGRLVAIFLFPLFLL